MACYVGLPIALGEVALVAPDLKHIAQLQVDADVTESVLHWSTQAQNDSSIIYFAIQQSQMLAGQIFLHDMNAETDEALIGYHLFREALRGRGIGTCALKLLQAFVIQETKLKKLIIITDKENVRSQQLAKKCGFQFVGGAWEDPENLMVFEWVVSRVAHNQTSRV